ncbi:hypothetical protein GmHk_02G003200 [Glycine max]|nr:hypothetical protein GmHk_02G003200 [Glycine max]
MLQCMCILHEVFAHDYVLSSTPHSPFPFTLSISSLVRRSPSPSGAPPSSLPLADRFLSPPPSVLEVPVNIEDNPGERTIQLKGKFGDESRDTVLQRQTKHSRLGRRFPCSCVWVSGQSI